MPVRSFIPRESLLKWSFPTTKGGLAGVTFAMMGLLLWVLGVVLSKATVPQQFSIIVANVANVVDMVGRGFLILGITITAIAVIAAAMVCAQAPVRIPVRESVGVQGRRAASQAISLT